MVHHIMNQPDTAGIWSVVYPDGKKSIVTVQASSASGIYCKELKMGGCQHCGFRDWDRKLQWEKIS